MNACTTLYENINKLATPAQNILGIKPVLGAEAVGGPGPVEGLKVLGWGPNVCKVSIL